MCGKHVSNFSGATRCCEVLVSPPRPHSPHVFSKGRCHVKAGRAGRARAVLSTCCLRHGTAAWGASSERASINSFSRASICMILVCPYVYSTSMLLHFGTAPLYFVCFIYTPLVAFDVDRPLPTVTPVDSYILATASIDVSFRRVRSLHRTYDAIRAGRRNRTRRSSTLTTAPPSGTSAGTPWGTCWRPAATTKRSSSGSGTELGTRWAANLRYFCKKRCCFAAGRSARGGGVRIRSPHRILAVVGCGPIVRPGGGGGEPYSTKILLNLVPSPLFAHPVGDRRGGVAVSCAPGGDAVFGDACVWSDC